MKNPYLHKDIFCIPTIDFDAEGFPSNLVEILDQSGAQWEHASGLTYVRTTRAWLCAENTIENINGRSTTLIHGEVDVLQYDDGCGGWVCYKQCDASFVLKLEKPAEYKQWLGVPADESVKEQRVKEGKEKSQGCSIS